MKTNIVKLEAVVEHNQSLNKGGFGTLKSVEVKETLLSDLPSFVATIEELRTGNRGEKTPIPITFSKLVETKYKCTLEHYLTSMGIHTSSMTIPEVAQVLGYDNYSASDFTQGMLDHAKGFASIGNIANTTQVDPTHRFIIPELIAAAINVGYKHKSLSNSWIASTINMKSSTEITLPQIKDGDTMPTELAEGADIPMGSVQFGQKKAAVQKVGIGFNITDELIMRSQMDILFIFIQKVGQDMRIANDSKAINILLNGEQADNSESAPVVGVITPASITYPDLKKVFTRGEALSYKYSKLVTDEDNNIDITGIDRFEGFDGETRLSLVDSIAGVPDKFSIDTYAIDPDQVLFIDPSFALIRLSFGGLKTEMARNARNQTDQMYITDWVGYAILFRDARVIMDKSLDISSNDFPEYMNPYTRQIEGYKSF